MTEQKEKLPPANLWEALGRKKPVLSPPARPITLQGIKPPAQRALPQAPVAAGPEGAGAPRPRSPGPKSSEAGAELPRPSRKGSVKYEPKTDLENVPRGGLEGLFVPGEGRKGLHETLGILVEAHQREAEAIMGRTDLLNRHEVIIFMRVFHRARHGIGGNLAKPMPWLSKAALDALRMLPSVGGKSRSQFVEAWQSSRDERFRKEQEDRLNREKLVGG